MSVLKRLVRLHPSNTITRSIQTLTMKAKKFVFQKPFQGMPKVSDFGLIEEELPPLKDGEFLCEAVFLSVDPYMRAYAKNYKVGMTMIGSQVAKVIESKAKTYPVGCHVVGNFGWRSHTISASEIKSKDSQPPYVVPELKGHPMSLYLGVLGMPGNTAYFGLKECCEPKAGETVVVSGAAGAVGSHVGQISKILGCKVIGFVGSNEKGEWIKTTGFDEYINYKTEKNLAVALKQKAPKGVDCYFDNVGGELSSTIIQQMNLRGRVGVCGSISAYNSEGELPKATILQPSIVMNQLTIKGLYATNYLDRWMEGILQNKEWVEAGKLKYKETIYEGFNKMPEALIGVLQGDNTGKAIVKV